MENKYKPIPFWSWNDELEEEELIKQIEWMHEQGIGGFFMHARGGLTTPYLGEKWFSCIEACLKKAKELNMEAYAYDENGWPSGFVGGLLLEDVNNRDMFVTYKLGKYDPKANASFNINKETIERVYEGEEVLNIYLETSNSTADICNPEVVKKFIDKTHEQYKKHDIYKNLRGFFTDEPQYNCWATPYTRMLESYFIEKYNENVLDRIALLFVDKEGYRDYRYKYFSALSELMLNSYAKQVYTWCDTNGYKLTGHYIEEVSLGAQVFCCGDIMSFYEYEHIPGCDHLGRDAFESPAARQVSSVISQLNKEGGICEIFGCAGWDATPLELKAIADMYVCEGINVVCHHLLPYSEHGQRKRDFPSHYSKINPWVDEGFKVLNDHISNLSKIVATSKEIVEVGLFYPITSAYFDYKREGDWANGFNIKELNNHYSSANAELRNLSVPYHLLDEKIMAKHAYVDGNCLVIGDYRYKYIVFPKGVLTMMPSTMELLKQYVSNGGKIHFMGDIPTYLEGKPYSHDYLANNCSMEEIISSKPFVSEYSNTVRLYYRENENKERFIIAFNNGDETDLNINIEGVNSFVFNGENISTSLHFNKYETKVLYFSSDYVGEEACDNQFIKLNDEYEVVGTPLNYLNIDNVRYSHDGVNYTEPLYVLAAFNNILKSRYQGDLYLKYEFVVKDIPNNLEVLIENMNTLEVKVNGVVVSKHKTVLEKDLWSFDIAKFISVGVNEIVVKINFIESDQVYLCLYGENIQESLKNCLVYDTTIESIYLRGDFGVFGDFKKGEAKDIVIGENFYIGKQKKYISNLIEDGYPFFRGKITLQQEIEVDNINKSLLIDKRFQLIDFYLNDEFIKRMILDYKLNLSKHLKVGKNVAKLDLIVSNRNLLGPHHALEEEVMWVGPHSFERFGEWNEKGEAPSYLKRYTFVRSII